MKKIYHLLRLCAIIFAMISLAGFSQNAWINEIHYDNTGTDAGEMIEVVVENAGSYNLADFAIYLYNGSGGAYYTTPAPLKTLADYTAGAVIGNFSFFYFIYPANGIQNGAPDGMAIAYQGVLVSGQFLSYEGTFVATNGPASGINSSSIGVFEAGTEVVGLSLQLSGSASGYAGFTWQGPAAATPGQLNNGQGLINTPLPEPSNYPGAFTAYPDVNITLTWTDAEGDQHPSNYLVKISILNNISAPVDGTAIPNDTDLSDGEGALNVGYGAETCTFYNLNGETEYFFKIYPYTNSGATIDFKTDGIAPSASAITRLVILSEGFEDISFGEWTPYSVASDKNWEVVHFPGALGTQYFAQMNGFNEDETSSDWLISPSLNLVYFNDEKIGFYSQWRYGGTDTELKLLLSNNYTGGDPTLATWTELVFTKSALHSIWAYSGDIPIADLGGANTHLAFHYLSTTEPRRWGVDEIVISGYTNGPSVPLSNWAILFGMLAITVFSIIVIRRRL